MNIHASYANSVLLRFLLSNLQSLLRRAHRTSWSLPRKPSIGFSSKCSNEAKSNRLFHRSASTILKLSHFKNDLAHRCSAVCNRGSATFAWRGTPQKESKQSATRSAPAGQIRGTLQKNLQNEFRSRHHFRTGTLPPPRSPACSSTRPPQASYSHDTAHQQPP